MRRVLLAHGLLGFAKIGALAYFNGVQACFNAPSSIFITPSVAPAGSIAERAAQLRTAIADAIPAATLDQGRAVHIIAHSMGGLDARYLIASNGLGCANWIASLTTVSTPHLGSPLADIVTGERTLSIAEWVNVVRTATGDAITSILEALGKPPQTGLPLSLFAPKAIFESIPQLRTYLGQIFGIPPEAFAELTTSAASNFNAQYSRLEGVPFQCYAGVSSPSQTMCRALYAPWAILKGIAGDNDGAVPVSSSAWGGTSPTVPADHFEEVGLATLFDGILPLAHFPVCNLYGPIDVWQRSLTPA
jgi:triacylglycerol lipase